MIEVDKILHLRKYVLTVFRSDTKSRVARSLYSSSSARERGYVLRSLNHCYVPQANSRPKYPVCGIRTFCTVAQSSVDEVNQKLTLFCDDVEHNRAWSADKLQEVIRLCDESNYQLQPSASLLLLKCCGNSLSTVKSKERQDLTDRVWQLAKKNGDALTLEHYNTLLNVYAENCSSVDPAEFLADMSVQPDDNTYRLLFNTAVKTGNIKHLQNIMSIILNKNISLNEDAFCALMQVHLTKDNVTEALNAITLAQNAKLPANKLYTELACYYAKQDDISNLVNILNNEAQSDVSILKILKSLSLSNNDKHIPVIANFLKGSAPTFKSEINNLITELVRADRAANAHMIINCVTLNEEIAKHTTCFVNNFLNQLIMINAPAEDITMFASDFMESKREPMALNNIAEISLKLGREKLSLAIFAAMRKKDVEIRPHYYWPLLKSAQNEGEAKIYSVIASMATMDVEMDFDTLVGYVLPYVNTANPIITMHRLRNIDISGMYRNLLNTPMVYFLLQNYRLKDVLYLHEYMNLKLDYRILMKSLAHVYFATQDVKACVKILTTSKNSSEYVSLFLAKLLKNSNSRLRMEDFHVLLEKFKEYEVKFSPEDAAYFKNKVDNVNVPIEMSKKLSKIIDEMVDENTLSVLRTIPHPKYMTTRELACHVIELKSKGYSIRNALHHLLEVYCQENNLRKAEEIKQELDRNQCSLRPGVKLQLFALYVKHDKLEEAEALLLEIQALPKSYLIDSNKILQFATALVKAGKSKMAFNIIENFTNINNKKDMSLNSAKLLTALAESEYYKHTEDMFHLLLQKKYCAVNTGLLRPLIAIPLKQNDIPAAIEVLTKCQRLYNMLPLALEIFTVLLREKDNPSIYPRMQNIDEYINNVYDMIVKTKDIQVANTIVVLALADLNKMEELQAVLQKERIAMNHLLHYYNYAQKSNNIYVLLRILEASQDSVNVNQSFLCDVLLNFYSQIGDDKGVLALWELILEKNIMPSQEFKQGFTEFLLSNKIPLPAEFSQSDISKVNVSNE